MPNYRFNIVGCILKYQDFPTAVTWLARAANEADATKLAEIIASVFEDLLSADRLDLSDELLTRLPSGCVFSQQRE